MLKIYINNEEVIANQNFTIQKHMLNTPSVILNNVCPKTWCDEKDYITNFYHPLDYSKCKIVDETFHPYDPGITTTINQSATLNNVDTTKEYELTQIEGNTTQETTTGKNLLPVTNQNLNINNVTFKAQNGKIVINGTANRVINGGYFRNDICFPVTLQAGTYYLTRNITDLTVGLINDNVEEVVTMSGSSSDTIKSFTLTATTKVYLYFYIAQGRQINNYSMEIMITTTNNTDFEPYTNGASPNPTYPQPINVVSGRQDIVVAGKNLFDINTVLENTVINTSGVEISTNNYTTSDYISVKPSTNYAISFRFISGDSVMRIACYDENKTFISRQDNSSTSNYIFTTPSNCYYIRPCYQKTAFNSLQIEKGTTATTYEAYKGQSYEINLGKQLLNLKNGTYTATNGITATVENGEITLNGTSTAVGFVQIDLNTRYNLEKNTPYTVSANNSVANADVRIRLDNNGNLDTTLSSINASRTITYNNETLLYTKVAIRVASGITLTNYKFKPMLEKGSSASSFSPYKTPIELCKIGTYQDRIYKENGTWYLHKEIGKYIFGGTNLAYDSTYNRAYTNVGGIIDNISIPSSNNETLKGLCNYLSILNATTFLGNTSLNGLAVSSNGTLSLRNTSMTTQAQYNTWLSTYKPILYYILATPTTTEITDSELISQLNSIELLEGLNNISITSGNLPGIMTIHYNFNDAYTTEDLLFCGVVKNSGNISLNPREPHYTTLQVLDFKDFLSSGETLDFVIYQKTILEAIQQVISTVQDYGFILGNVNILNSNEIIGAYSTKDKTAYDVFNYIADITQSRWTTRMIDENTVAIDFYDPTLMPQGTEIDYTNAYFNDKLIDDMKYSYGTNNYRNKQVMISKQVYSNISQAQTIVANGYQTQFPTEQPIGKINSITSNGIPLTFATFNEKDMGYVADFYYNPGDNYFESDDLRSTGEVLIIDYVAIVEGRQVITNSTEIDRINESTGRKGIIARYETRNDATTSTELQKIGESYIKYKGTPEIVLTIQSRKNTWEVGQRVQFNAPIDELDTEYMVRSKKINYIANQQENESQLFYTYELVSSFNSETEINYFDNQRAKSTGNIGEGEYISRNIDIESTANIIFYDTETTEVQVDGDNVLNSILNSPFTS